MKGYSEVPWWGLLVEQEPEKASAAIRSALADSEIEYRENEIALVGSASWTGFFVRRQEEPQEELAEKVALGTGRRVVLLDMSDVDMATEYKNGKWELLEETPRKAMKARGLPLPYQPSVSAPTAMVSVFEGVSLDELVNVLPGEPIHSEGDRFMVSRPAGEAASQFLGRSGFRHYAVSRRLEDGRLSVIASRSEDDSVVSTTEAPGEILGERDPESIVNKLGIPHEWLVKE